MVVTRGAQGADIYAAGEMVHTPRYDFISGSRKSEDKWLPMRLGDNQVLVVDDNKTNRRIYEEIVRRRRDPALLEYVGRDAFQASIYPIPAGVPFETPDADRLAERRDAVLNAIYAAFGADYEAPDGDGDALVTTDVGVAVAVWTADCVPVLVGARRALGAGLVRLPAPGACRRPRGPRCWSPPRTARCCSPATRQMGDASPC